MIERGAEYLDKAEESLTGGESEFVNDRYNNSANRAYYAVFQAAIHALLDAGIRPPGNTDHWGHDYVQAQFVGLLINRRKRYSTELRNTLEQNYRLREAADYRRDRVTAVQVARAVRRAEAFVAAVTRQGGEAS
ncbi:MAG: HEPN domain-containing protein [Chloroflexota bacterium]|nr:HEPN domain-containing protein [Chloroflexota bacterium]